MGTHVGGRESLG